MSKTFKELFLKNLVGGTEPDTLRQIALDTTILKAMDTDATGTEYISNSRIDDQGKGSMNDARRLTKEEVQIGPTQAASGGNAEKQVREYSNFDPQQAIVENYNALSAELGTLKGMLKSFLDAFAAASAKSEEKEEKEEKEASKSTISPEAEVIKAMADEMEEEDKKEASKATSEASGSVKAAAMMIKAAEELDARSLAAKKAGDSAKFKSLKGKVEEALSKALQMIASAPDKATPTAKALASDIHAIALVKGFSAVAAQAAKAEDEEGEEKEKEASKKAEASETDHMQTEWPTGAKADSQATLERVLKGLAVLEGNVGTLFEAVAGKSKNGEGLKAIDLGLAAKSTTGTDPKSADPAALYKSNPDQWELIKIEKIQEQVDSGSFGLQEELACQAILSTAQAARAGAIPNEMLMARVSSASERVRGMFPELLSA